MERLEKNNELEAEIEGEFNFNQFIMEHSIMSRMSKEGEKNEELEQKDKILNRIKLSYEKQYEKSNLEKKKEEEIEPKSLVMRLNKPREQRIIDFKPPGLREGPKRDIKIEEGSTIRIVKNGSDN